MVDIINFIISELEKDILSIVMGFTVIYYGSRKYSVLSKKSDFSQTQNKKMFNKCLGASRYFYNQGVSIVEQKLKQNDYSVLKRYILIRIVIQLDSDVDDKMKWQKKYNDTLDEAIVDVLKAYKFV